MSYHGTARLWQAWSIVLGLVELDLENFHMYLHSPQSNMCSALELGIMATPFPSLFFIFLSLDLFFPPFPTRNVFLSKCKVMRDLVSPCSWWSAQERMSVICICRSFAQTQFMVDVPNCWISEWMMLSCLFHMMLYKTCSLTPYSQWHMRKSLSQYLAQVLRRD